MTGAPPITYALDGDRVGWIVFDAPSSRANVFSPAAQAALDGALRQARASAPRAVVVISGKERIFVAGADLKWLAALPDAAAATEFARQGQQLFQRLNDLPMPVVCAIHGACAGGGFELALACHWRIASDAPSTQIGLPETGIGTIPGWGGCVRLPRLIGVKAALDHILSAQLLPATQALRVGLVHELAPAAELKTRAKAVALKLVDEPPPPRPPPAAVIPECFAALREAVRAKTRGHQPALSAAIDVVEQTAALHVDAAMDIEARLFGQVTAGDVCKNMVHVFFLRDAAKKRTLEGWFSAAASAGKGAAPIDPIRIRSEREAAAPDDIAASSRLRPVSAPVKRTGVVGAGVMGSGIAQWLATRGFDVVMRDVQPELLERGLSVVRGLCDEAVKRGKLAPADAAAALARIATTTAWDGFADCDLVIEAIVENAAAKQKLFTELAGIVRSDAVLASNTSALPIEEIAGHVPNPARTLGIHFFNPVSRMPLAELVLGRETSREAAERALALTQALGKSPVICRSSPGFLVTRVLFFYLNEAVRLWEQGLSTAAIDEALRDFGWPMGPLRLIDEVGIDVTDSIFGEMEHYFPERFTRSTACARLLAAGMKGRKNGTSAGFYAYAGRQTLNDPETRRLIGRLGDLTLDAQELVARLMRVMVDEAERCLAEGVVQSPDEVDFALLTGAGFPAFRGGLMRWARRARSGVST